MVCLWASRFWRVASLLQREGAFLRHTRIFGSAPLTYRPTQHPSLRGPYNLQVVDADSNCRCGVRGQFSLMVARGTLQKRNEPFGYLFGRGATVGGPLPAVFDEALYSRGHASRWERRSLVFCSHQSCDFQVLRVCHTGEHNHTATRTKGHTSMSRTPWLLLARPHTLVPSNGRLPVKVSHITTPKAYTSTDWSLASQL